MSNRDLFPADQARPFVGISSDRMRSDDPRVEGPPAFIVNVFHHEQVGGGETLIGFTLDYAEAILGAEEYAAAWGIPVLDAVGAPRP